MKKILLLSLLFLTGCFDDDSKSNPKISELENKVASLETQISATNKTVASIQQSQFDSAWDVLMLKGRFESTAYFNPGSKGYAPVWTSAGNLLVALNNMTKYANGYKLTFQIGNPTLATFTDVKMTVGWNKVFEKTDQYNEWEKNTKSTTVPLDNSLLPGKWNNITVTISPAKEEETGYIKVTLDTSNVYLYK